MLSRWGSTEFLATKALTEMAFNAAGTMSLAARPIIDSLPQASIPN